MRAPLGEFEVVVLLAVLQLDNESHGSRVRDAIHERTGRRPSRGAVYVTLDRLEEKGLLTSKLIDAPHVRGGTRRLFRTTSTGVRAVKHALATVARMRQGLEPLLGDV